jgi:hypothetical protein
MYHVVTEGVTKMITWLNSFYGEDMRVSRYRVHDYIGTTLDSSGKGEVKITMSDYLKGVPDDFPYMITEIVMTPTTTHLFDICSAEECVMYY